MFTNTEDNGSYMESYGAVEGASVWSQSASFLGLFSSDFAQRGIQIEDRILLGAVWLTWSRLVLLRRFPSGF